MFYNIAAKRERFLVNSKKIEDNANREEEKEIFFTKAEFKDEMIFALNDKEYIKDIRKVIHDENDTSKFNHFFDTNNAKIYTFSSTVIEAIEVIYDMLKSDEDNEIYGVLIQTGSHYYNIMHPIQLFLMSKMNSIAFDQIVKVHVYSMKANNHFENDFRDEIKEKFRFFLEDMIADIHIAQDCNTINVKKDLNFLIKSTQIAENLDLRFVGLANKDNFVESTFNDIVSKIKYNKTVHLNYVNDLYIEIGTNSIKYENKNIYVPVNIINEGVIYPYFGLVGIKISNNQVLGGIQLSPFLSPNIGEPKEGRESDVMSVCTGDLSNRRQKGWKTLTHANLLSPYFKNVIQENTAEIWHEVCRELSMEIMEIIINKIRGEQKDEVL